MGASWLSASSLCGHLCRVSTQTQKRSHPITVSPGLGNFASVLLPHSTVHMCVSQCCVQRRRVRNGSFIHPETAIPLSESDLLNVRGTFVQSLTAPLPESKLTSHPSAGCNHVVKPLILPTLLCFTHNNLPPGYRPEPDDKNQTPGNRL